MVDGHVTITSLPNQWWIQWGVPGPPTYFQTKLRSEGRKKQFWETPPPYLKVWILHSNCIVSYQFFFSIGLHATAKGVQGSIIMLNGGFDLLI